MRLFDTEAFTDPTAGGKPSFVRKSLAWTLLFAGGLIVLGVIMFGLVKLDVAKEISAYIIKVLAAITGILGIAYGAMQGAKGYAQGQAAKSATTSTTTAMATPNPSPQPTTQPPSTAPPASATTSTTTATGDSTKGGAA